MSDMHVTDKPTSPGWYARRIHGSRRTYWIGVDAIDGALMTWMPMLRKHVAIGELCGADIEWYGPVHLPAEFGR